MNIRLGGLLHVDAIAFDEPANDQCGDGTGLGIGNFSRENRKRPLGYEILGKYRKKLTEHFGYLGQKQRNYNRATGLSLAVIFSPCSEKTALLTMEDL